MVAPPVNPSTGLYLAATPLVDLRLGAEPVLSAYLGANKFWTNPDIIADDFTLLGFLATWINQFINDAEAGIGGVANTFVSDGLGGILNGGTGDLVGSLAKFLPNIDTSSGNWGTIITQIPSELQTSICDDLNQLGGLLTNKDGSLVGLINGLPIIGGALQWVESLFGGSGLSLGSITSMVGSIPVVSDLGQLIGVVGDTVTGALADPQNFITNIAGDVVGTLSCGTITLPGGSSQNINYPIGVVGGMARMLIPDGLVSLSTQTSTMRNASLVPADDGWVQAQIASNGDTGLYTQLWRRFTNATNGVTSGVGIDLRDSVVSIVRRVDGTDTIVKPALCSFTGGDLVHMNQTGNTHTVYLNGELAGEPWIDTGATAFKGSGYRAVAMTMQGGQDMNGPRRYSPSLAWFEAA